MYLAILRALRISYSDDDPSALASLQGDNQCTVTQISVKLDDGTWLLCDDTNDFADAPFGPFIVGPNGDVAIYPTHEIEFGKKKRELTATKDTHWGANIQFIPANRVTQISFRHKKDVNRVWGMASAIVARWFRVERF